MANVLGVSVEELKSYDSRLPIDDLKRIAGTDPALGFALRKFVDKQVSAEELLDLLKKKPDREKPR